MDNETSTAVMPATLVAILSLLEIIFIPGMAFKIVALILTSLAGTVYLFYIFRDFSQHFSFLCVSYSGFGILLFLTDMGYVSHSIGRTPVFAAMIVAFSVPVLFCIVTAFIMRETQRNCFGDFFKGMILIFFISLILFYVYWFTVYNVDHSMTERVARLVPFATLASFIERLIYGSLSGVAFARYLAFSILVYVPFGIIVGTVGQHLRLITELLLLIVLPVIIESLQYAFLLNGCDIDDMIFGFLGGILGLGFFKILNYIALNVTGASLTGLEKRLEE